MKLNKVIAAALSGAVAAAALTTTASAYITVPSDAASLLTVNSQSWSKMISSSYDIDYSKLGQIQAVITLTDPAQYEADKASGFYSDGVTTFVEFSGNIAFGSSAEWIAYGFDSLADITGDSDTATITGLGDGSYILTASIPAESAAAVTGRCSVTFAEWGNTSPDYSLTLNSFSLIGTDGTTILTYNGSGNATVEPAAVETTAATEAPVETTAETTTTTEATTTTAEETTTTTEETTTVPEETSEETEEAAEETTTTTTTAATTTTTKAATTTEAETTIAETTTAAPVATTAAVQQAVASDSDNFASRNSSLMIFAIVAGVVILAAIIGFILISVKKKK